MTQNERVAEVMGWECESDIIWDGGRPRYPEISIEDAKLLQARMVADGWMITIRDYPRKKRIVSATGYNEELSRYENAETNSEPAALHALFVKVYNIGGEG